MKVQGSSVARCRLYTILLIWTVLVGVILACGSPTMLATVNLNEDQINQVLQRATVEDELAGWRFEIERVELLDGFLRVYGTYLPKDSEPATGSFDITLSVEEAALSVQVTAVDIHEALLSDDWLQQVSAQLAQNLSRAAARDRQGIEIVSTKITSEALRIGLRFLP